MHRTVLTLALVVLAAGARADLLAVANRGGTTIGLVDPETLQVVATIGVGNDPHEITIGPDGRHAYVSNYGGGNGTTISVVDLHTRTKIKDIPVAPLVGPHGIVSAAGKIWFSSEKTDSIGRYDPASDQIDWIGHTNQEGTHMIAVRADGTAAYSGNIGSSTASVVPVTGSESTSKVNIAVVAEPEGIALAPNQNELWVGSRKFQGIAIIDLASEKVVANIAPGTFAYRLTFSPDGRHVLVPRPGEVAVFDTAQRQELRVIATGGQPFSVVVAPDNRTAFIAMGGPTQVLKVDLTTGQILATAAYAAIPDGIAYAALEPNPPAPPRKKRRAVRK